MGQAVRPALPSTGRVLYECLPASHFSPQASHVEALLLPQQTGAGTTKAMIRSHTLHAPRTHLRHSYIYVPVHEEDMRLFGTAIMSPLKPKATQP